MCSSFEIICLKINQPLHLLAQNFHLENIWNTKKLLDALAIDILPLQVGVMLYVNSHSPHIFVYSPFVVWLVYRAQAMVSSVEAAGTQRWTINGTNSPQLGDKNFISCISLILCRSRCGVGTRGAGPRSAPVELIICYCWFDWTKITNRDPIGLERYLPTITWMKTWKPLRRYIQVLSLVEYTKEVYYDRAWNETTQIS